MPSKTADLEFRGRPMSKSPVERQPYFLYAEVYSKVLWGSHPMETLQCPWIYLLSGPSALLWFLETFLSPLRGPITVAHHFLSHQLSGNCLLFTAAPFQTVPSQLNLGFAPLLLRGETFFPAFIKHHKLMVKVPSETLPRSTVSHLICDLNYFPHAI